MRTVEHTHIDIDENRRDDIQRRLLVAANDIEAMAFELAGDITSSHVAGLIILAAEIERRKELFESKVSRPKLRLV